MHIFTLTKLALLQLIVRWRLSSIHGLLIDAEHTQGPDGVAMTERRITTTHFYLLIQPPWGAVAIFAQMDTIEKSVFFNVYTTR